VTGDLPSAVAGLGSRGLRKACSTCVIQALATVAALPFAPCRQRTTAVAHGCSLEADSLTRRRCINPDPILFI
jgi:hypothetical protein